MVLFEIFIRSLDPETLQAAYKFSNLQDFKVVVAIADKNTLTKSRKTIPFLPLINISFQLLTFTTITKRYEIQPFFI